METFRPSNGELLIRDSLAHGPVLSPEAFRKEERRPQTQGGYRFGQLSHSSFFTRHNPHPSRVKHIKGLLNVPICSVNDEGYFASPRYSLQFPPNNFANQKLKHWKNRIPVNSININRQLHSFNTMTGLQHFTGLNSYPFREKAVPKLGLVPVTEAWRDELATFTRSLELSQNDKDAVNSKPADNPRPRSTVYSPETGRLIPPSSRALSRGPSRRSQTNSQFVGGNLQHISSSPDIENLVFMMLCQILQTEDINAVQAWLCSAGEKEKDLVMNLVKSALAGAEEYYKQYPVEFIPDNGKAKLPPIYEKPLSPSGEINRLVLDSNDNGESHVVHEDRNDSLPTVEVAPIEDAWQLSEETGEAADPMTTKAQLENEDFTFQPPVNNVFKHPTTALKPLTPFQPARLVTAPRKERKTSIPRPSPESRLKYTKSSFKDKIEAMWNQSQSVNTF